MADLLQSLRQSLPGLGKAVFSQPTDGAAYHKVLIRPVRIKDRPMFQAELFTETKAFHQNLDEESLLRLVSQELDGRYRQVLITDNLGACQYVLKAAGGYKRTSKAAVPMPGSAKNPDAGHNRAKTYILAEGEPVPALVDLGVFTPDYRIVKSKYDKFKQINRFIQIIDDRFREDSRSSITILDFGCGKSYLTFILYYYFAIKRGMDTTIIGYDLKADVVERCNAIALKYGYDKLKFVVADVTKDTLSDMRIDMVVTLHACDTATDYALHYAITHKVDSIFSVPCCQHEINSAITPGGDLDIFLKHGIIKDRMSALLTDSIRAGILEDMGYSVDMLEFIDLEHSPKNIMLRAYRNRRPAKKNIPEYLRLADSYHFSQKLLGLITEGDNR